MVSCVLMVVVSTEHVDEPAGESACMRGLLSMILQRRESDEMCPVSVLNAVADFGRGLVEGSAMDWGVVWAIAQTYRVP